jgi:hypothetical protein
LINDRNSEIRADAVLILLDIVILNPSKMKTNRQIFNTLQVLAKDPNIQIRRIIAEAISRLIQQIPKEVNYIMQLIYTFTRESDDTIIQSISFALKVLKNEHAERLTEIKTHLKRVERKTHNAQLNTLIEALEAH